MVRLTLTVGACDGAPTLLFRGTAVDIEAVRDALTDHLPGTTLEVECEYREGGVRACSIVGVRREPSLPFFREAVRRSRWTEALERHATLSDSERAQWEIRRDYTHALLNTHRLSDAFAEVAAMWRALDGIDGEMPFLSAFCALPAAWRLTFVLENEIEMRSSPAKRGLDPERMLDGVALARWPTSLIERAIEQATQRRSELSRESVAAWTAELLRREIDRERVDALFATYEAAVAAAATLASERLARRERALARIQKTFLVDVGPTLRERWLGLSAAPALPVELVELEDYFRRGGALDEMRSSCPAARLAPLARPIGSDRGLYYALASADGGTRVVMVSSIAENDLGLDVESWLELAKDPRRFRDRESEWFADVL